MAKEITTAMVKDLREQTGAGILDCKKALEQTGGDFQQAAEILRAKGFAAAAKKAERVANQGRIESYIHQGRIGSLVELNCETDFVARTDDFKNLAREIARQVVASSPVYVDVKDVPEDVKAQQGGAQSDGAGDEKALSGYYEQTVLMRQPYIKNPSQSIYDLIQEHIAKLGENIVVRRFARFEIGQ